MPLINRKRGLSPKGTVPGLTMGLMLGLACGQGPAHTLEGSLSTVMDLRYDTAQVVSADDEVAVRFVRAQGDGENTVLKVAARVEPGELQAGQVLDLTALTPDGGQRGAVSRNVLDEPQRLFPPLVRGQLRLDALPAPHERVSGEVSLTFENGTQLASGRTVYGTFSAEVPP